LKLAALAENDTHWRLTAIWNYSEKQKGQNLQRRIFMNWHAACFREANDAPSHGAVPPPKASRDASYALHSQGLHAKQKFPAECQTVPTAKSP